MTSKKLAPEMAGHSKATWRNPRNPKAPTTGHEASHVSRQFGSRVGSAGSRSAWDSGAASLRPRAWLAGSFMSFWNFR